MSTSINPSLNEQPVSGIDAGPRGPLGESSRPDAEGSQAWFASDVASPGAISLPTTLAGTGSQNLERLVDGILAPIGA